MEGKEIASRTLIQAAVMVLVAIVALLLWFAAEVLLVIFGGILFALLFVGIARWISKKTRLPEKIGLVISLLAPLLLLVLAAWLIAPNAAEQANELSKRIPKAAQQLEQQILQYEWANRLLQQKDQIQRALPNGSQTVSFAAKFFSSTFGALGNFLIALVIGVLISVSPRLYVNGLVLLAPPDKRHRTREVLESTGSSLSKWLLAKITSMIVIGALTTFGLWIIGIDLALVLGLIAGLLSFVPNIGPIISFIPAGLIALISGPQTVAYVAALYLSVQAFESYILMPVLNQRMVDLPPALTIGMQLLLGVLVGVLGVILAAPLTAAAMVMIQMWYIGDVLGDKRAA